MPRKFGQRGVAGRFRVAKHLPLAALFAHELTQTFESFGVVSFAETGEMVPDGNQSSVGGDVEVSGFEVVVAEVQLGQSRLQFIERRPQGFGIELCGRRWINWRRDCPSWTSATTTSNPETSTSTLRRRLRIPVRYHFARFGEGHDAEGFERLRQFVSARQTAARGGCVLRRGTVPLAPALARISGAVCSWARCPDRPVRVEDGTRLRVASIPKTDRLSRRSSSGPPTSAKDAPRRSRPHRAWA